MYINQKIPTGRSSLLSGFCVLSVGKRQKYGEIVCLRKKEEAELKSAVGRNLYYRVLFAVLIEAIRILRIVPH